MTLTEAEIAALRDYAENGYPVNVTYRAGSGGHGFGDVGGLDPEDIRAVLAEIARLRKIEEAARAVVKAWDAEEDYDLDEWPATEAALRAALEAER